MRVPSASRLPLCRTVVVVVVVVENGEGELLSEVEKGDRHVSALCSRSPLLVEMYGAFHPTSVAFSGLLWSVSHLWGHRKTEQGQENTMEVVRDTQGECACPPQKGGCGHRGRPCKWRSVQSLGERSTRLSWFDDLDTLRPRTAPCSCPRNMKWSQKINTPSSAQLPAGIARVFTRCQNGQGYVPPSRWWNAFSQMLSKANAEDQPARLLVSNSQFTTLLLSTTRESVGHPGVASSG